MLPCMRVCGGFVRGESAVSGKFHYVSSRTTLSSTQANAFFLVNGIAGTILDVMSMLTSITTLDRSHKRDPHICCIWNNRSEGTRVSANP